MVFGPQTLHRLPQMVSEVREQRQPVVDVSFPEIEKFDRLPEPRAEGPTAFVSIMEGCSKYCTFCVVPYTRGEEISRPLDDVVTEAVNLAAQGVREINLLGQNVNAYLGPMHDGQLADLATLIYYIAAIDGIDRIRFTTSHPREFTDSLIQAYAEIPKLANFLHLPVQHGADRVLSRMKRGHTALEYKQKIRKLRQVRPDISISSDFIVGFPGETDADFEATMKLIADVGFIQFHLQRTAGDAGGQLRRRNADVGQERAAQRFTGAYQSAGHGHQSGHGWFRAIRTRRETVQKGPQAACRAHREHALGQFRRRSRLYRTVRGRADYRSAAQLPAGPPGQQSGRCLSDLIANP
jgi:MiaB/RimO family radical SAM methylthiotransferase